jgi:hypothetical protein
MCAVVSLGDGQSFNSVDTQDTWDGLLLGDEVTGKVIEDCDADVWTDFVKNVEAGLHLVFRVLC